MRNIYFKTIIYNFFKSILSYIGVMFVPLLLSTTDYGIYALLIFIFNNLRTFYDINFTSSLYTFQSESQITRNFILNVFKLFTVQYLLNIAITLTLFYFQKNILNIDSIKFSILMLAMHAIFFQSHVAVIASQALEARGSHVDSNKYLMLAHLICVIMLICLWNFEIITITSVLLIYLLVFLGFTIFCWHELLIHCSVDDTISPFWGFIRGLYNYSHYLFLASIVIFVFEYIDRLLILRFSGLEEQAILGFTLQFTYVIYFFGGAVLKIYWRIYARNSGSDEVNTRSMSFMINIYLVFYTGLILIAFNILVAPALFDKINIYQSLFVSSMCTLYFLVNIISCFNQYIITTVHVLRKQKIYFYKVTVSFLIINICSYYTMFLFSNKITDDNILFLMGLKCFLTQVSLFYILKREIPLLFSDQRRVGLLVVLLILFAFGLTSLSRLIDDIFIDMIRITVSTCMFVLIAVFVVMKFRFFVRERI